MLLLVAKLATVGVVGQAAGIGDGGIDKEGMHFEAGGGHDKTDHRQAVQLLVHLVPGKAVAHLVGGVVGQL